MTDIVLPNEPIAATRIAKIHGCTPQRVYYALKQLDLKPVPWNRAEKRYAPDDVRQIIAKLREIEANPWRRKPQPRVIARWTDPECYYEAGDIAFNAKLPLAPVQAAIDHLKLTPADPPIGTPMYRLGQVVQVLGYLAAKWQPAGGVPAPLSIPTAA